MALRRSNRQACRKQTKTAKLNTGPRTLITHPTGLPMLPACAMLGAYYKVVVTRIEKDDRWTNLRTRRLVMRHPNQDEFTEAFIGKNSIS